ncbi:Oxidoreductase, Gfo/Idh/MocA family [Candidatus Rhodobacter oscarellae]|uniref:Oxidoreductase, Gfo/Idh/MocA family n=1 Tax=Candidatus Rhodobacter oscarellae TaxID=1675527 RepID=A0A0J9E5W8_9RHOB|nr:Gfo/Idh/MocA family oxidoreductase [Candidatus Rhodobacter lobularis]KMW58140.1 Oxidoreductase, Gfo/Idh/MocA family [Candidatus Rhodobacter lobularis]
MSDTVRWGVLGAAKFAREHMAPAIHAASGAKLAALATSAPEKAAPFQAFQPDLRVHLDYDALLNDPEIDAVYIPLPNHLHVEWALKALDAGKHVLCEKPLAMQAEQFDAVIAKRDATGLVAAEAYMIVHHPQWQKAREIYRSGALGKIWLVDGVFSYDNSGDPGNIRNRPETGGGSIPDIGVYTFGSARFVTGEEPLAVDARIRRENGVDVFAHVTGDFPSFRYSSITSMRMALRQEMAFHGEAGVMRLTCPFNAGVFSQAELRLEGPGLVTETHRWPGVNHYVEQVQNFGAAVRGAAAYPCPLEFSKGTQAMIDMVWAAEQEIA